MDVSGSINFEDYNRFVNEIEKIAKQVSNPKVRYIQFHSTVSLDIYVPLKKIRSVGIPETGGTNLGPALNRLASERNKKLTIVFTDGYVEEIKNEYHYPIILFV
jgi:predicted metal-dependent peptidase